MCFKKTFNFTCGCSHKNTTRLCTNKLDGKRCSGTTNNGSKPMGHPCSGHQCPKCFYGKKQYSDTYCKNCS